MVAGYKCTEEQTENKVHREEKLLEGRSYAATSTLQYEVRRK